MTTTNTQPIHTVWCCRCWDTERNRYDLLAYVAETKAEAYSKCANLNPTYDIESVYHIADY